MTENALDRFVWLDIETTGLNHLTDYIVEVGVRITDVNMKLIDEFDCLVWDSPTYDRKLQELEIKAEAGEKGATAVMKMHTASGLWDAAREQGLSTADAEQAVVDFLKGHGVGYGDPMAGSSVHFDRMMLRESMPEVEGCFGYRNIDVSSIKELCMRLNPDLYKKLDKFGPPKSAKHRTLADLVDTANELVWYADNFFHVADNLGELVYS